MVRNIFTCIFLLAVSAAAAPGRLDLAFPHLLTAGSVISAIEIQPDGNILIAGPFTTTRVVFRKDIARLNADGSIDLTFNAGMGVNVGSISKIKLQPDGKILIGGSFNTINGTPRNAIARLNSDGSVDQSFALSGLDITFVFDLDLQADGKVLASASNLIGSSFVARLQSNGANDSGFGQPFFFVPFGNGYRVADVPVEGKILIGGNFTANGKSLTRILNNGGQDPSFLANVTSTTFIEVHPLPLPGGKILIFGKFDSVNGVARNALARLENNGGLDTLFDPSTAGIDAILAIAIQADGKIVIAGRGFPQNSVLRGNIARLNPDGSLDTTFYPGRGANGDVKALRIQNTGNVLVGGSFSRWHIFPRSGLVRLQL
jgi:uncharacterized delta-60 repeat protein